MTLHLPIRKYLGSSLTALTAELLNFFQPQVTSYAPSLSEFLQLWVTPQSFTLSGLLQSQVILLSPFLMTAYPSLHYHDEST